MNDAGAHSELLATLAAAAGRDDVAEAFVEDVSGARALLALAGMADRLVAATPTDRTELEEALGVLGATLGCDSVAIWRLEAGEPDRYRIHARWKLSGGPMPDVLEIDRWGLHEVHAALGRGELVEVWRSTSTDAIRALLEAFNDEGVIVVPVIVDGAWWGVALFGVPLGDVAPWSSQARACLRAVAALTSGVITRAREAEMMRRLTHTLEAARRRDSLSTLAAGVAHDLNNVLNVLRTGLDLIEARGELIPQDLARMDRAIDAASALSNQLYGFAGHTTPEPMPVDLPRLLRRGEAVLDVYMSPAVEMRKDFPADLPPVLGHPVTVGQAVGNLVLNAVEAFEGAPGHVVVGARPEVRSGRAGVLLWVQDDGPGVPEELRAELFQPLTSSRGSGRGMGLASAASIARHLGGSLTHVAPPQGGSRFELWLPSPPEMG